VTEQDLENARLGYAALGEAYRSGDANDFRPNLEAFWDRGVVLEPAGVMVDSSTARGWDAILRVIAEQMKAFTDGSMWIEALEFIDAGDRLVVPYRFGGRARHTGLDLEFAFVHVLTMHDGKATRVDVFETKAQALEAVGLPQ